jgi:hypothetical protein
MSTLPWIACCNDKTRKFLNRKKRKKPKKTKQKNKKTKSVREKSNTDQAMP